MNPYYKFWCSMFMIFEDMYSDAFEETQELLEILANDLTGGDDE